MTANAHTGKLK